MTSTSTFHYLQDDFGATLDLPIGTRAEAIAASMAMVRSASVVEAGNADGGPKAGQRETSAHRQAPPDDKLPHWFAGLSTLGLVGLGIYAWLR